MAPIRFAAEAVARAVRVNWTHAPNPKLRARYEAKAALSADVYPTLWALNRKLQLDSLMF
jgi:hypothetical protein